MFCESLAEFLKINKSIKSLDISCNFIDDSNAATLMASLVDAPNIIEIDVRNNKLSEETEEEVNEIITKNLLMSKGIPFKKLGDYAGGGGEEKPEANAQAAAANPSPAKTDNAANNDDGEGDKGGDDN